MDTDQGDPVRDWDFDDLRDLRDLHEDDIDDINDLGPPPPTPPRRRGGGGQAPLPAPDDRAIFNPWMLLLIVGLLSALCTLQLTIISMGARGGEAAVYALSAVFAVLFLGPFYVGAVWFTRARAADR